MTYIEAYEKAIETRGLARRPYMESGFGYRPKYAGEGSPKIPGPAWNLVPEYYDRDEWEWGSCDLPSLADVKATDWEVV